MNIFYIETNPTDVQRLHDCLKETESSNLKFSHADNLETAKQILDREKFDIIFLNPRLPGCIGLESLRNLRSLILDTPIIIISCESNKNLAQNALSHGAEDYLMNNELNCKLVMKSIRYAIERKNAKNRNRTTEDRLKKLVNTTPSIIYVTKISSQLFCTYTCSYISDNFPSMMGYSKHEMVGNSTFWLSCIHPDDREEVISYIDEKIKERSYGFVEYRFKAKDGSYRWIHDNFNVSCNDEGEPVEVLGSWSDITTFKDATDEATRLLAAISSTDESIVITDTDGKIIYVNPAFSRITGYSYADAIGNNPSILKSGNQSKKFYDNLWETITRGEVFKATFINKNKAGNKYYSEQTITPVKDETGRIIEYICVGRDITEKLNLDNQLRQAQKMEAIGQLAGGIAHDFNNRLTIILGNLQLLERMIPNDKAALELVQNAINASKSGATLTQRLLSYSRQQVLENENLNINRVIENINKLIIKVIGENIEINLNLEENLWLVETDANQFEEMLLNLCVNARDAMPSGGHLKIETNNISFGINDKQNLLYKIPAGDYVKITVSDTGCGMTVEEKEKIFEPFYTTKDKTKGTGLGMSMVYGFIKQVNGFINVYSEEGHGTSINVYFKKSENQNIDNKYSNKKEEIINMDIFSDKIVLVVEDDEYVRNISIKLLKELGFKTIETENARAAIDILDHGNDVDTVFTDMMMPGGMNGIELVREIRKSQPQMKAIVTSGYSEDYEITKDMNIHWIKKPFTRETLVDSFSRLYSMEM